MQFLLIGQIAAVSTFFIGKMAFEVDYAFDPTLEVVLQLIMANIYIVIIYNFFSFADQDFYYRFYGPAVFAAQCLCLVIGGVGALMLLKGMDLSLQEALSASDSALNYLEENFFNSSYAILWQANIASMFFAGVRASNGLLAKVLALVALSLISLRGAYLYLIIGAMYYLAGMVIGGVRISTASGLRLLASFGFLIILTAFASYNIYDMSDLFFKFIPYTYGNYINLFFAYDSNLGLHRAECYDFILGLSSIIEYIGRYFDIWLPRCNVELPFLQQTKNAVVFGNTATGFIPMAYIGVLYYLPVLTVTAIVMKLADTYGRSNLFAMVYLPVAFSASMLMFATGGFLLTTRIFPALLFIAPIILFLKLKRGMVLCKT